MMKTSKNMLLLILALAIAFSGGAPGYAGMENQLEAFTSAKFAADARALTATPHRLTGSQENKAATDYVEKRLREIGIKDIVNQEFITGRVVPKQCNAVIGEKTANPVKLDLFQMRPNGIVLPVTTAEGLSGPIVDVGNGEFSGFGNKDVQDAIVVMDYNAGSAWLRAFRLGAKAVIFVSNGPAISTKFHYVESNANLPRFFYNGSRTDLAEGNTISIDSTSGWETTTGRNIVALIPGTAAKYSQDQEEMILLAAHLDTFGEVPTLTPGARGAANCAGLLKLAEYFHKNPTNRHILIVFFNGQAQGHAGSSAFYRALEEKDPLARIEKRRTYPAEERPFLESLQALIGSKDPLAESDAHRELINRLKAKGSEHAYTIGEELYQLRKQQNLLKQGNAEYKTSAEYIKLEESIKSLQATKDIWNDLRRALGKDELRGISEPVKKLLALIIEEVRTDVDARLMELTVEERALDSDVALKKMIGKYWIDLHASLMLGDFSERWGLVIGGNSMLHSVEDKPGLYGKVQNAFYTAYKNLPKDQNSLPIGTEHFETSSADGSMENPRLLMAVPFLAHSGEVAGLSGIFNLVLGTVQEPLLREGTPDDTLAMINLERVEQQVREVGVLIRQLANEESISLKRNIVNDTFYVLPTFSGTHAAGPTVMGKFQGSAMQNKPMPNTTIMLRIHPTNIVPYMDRKPIAFDNYILLRTNYNGSYGYGPVVKSSSLWATWHNGFAAYYDDRGTIIAASDKTSGNTTMNTRLNTFECRQGSEVLPPQMQAWEQTAVLRSLANAGLDEAKSNLTTIDGVVNWYCEKKIDSIKIFGLNGVIGLNNGEPSITDEDADIENADGTGFAIDRTWTSYPVTKRSATDLWRLNESRLGILRAKDIMNNSIEELHGLTRSWLMASDSKTANVGQNEALASAALMTERRVYNDTKLNLFDLVHAVLILLALSVPFAFALERLLIGATNIYRQVSWFAGFFALTFLLLFVTHPAFAIAKTPIIIFLGFAVVVLSGLVIFVIMRKFEVELKVLQGLTSTVHGADVSRFSTIMAAMAMGISTMRRRPLRTALTAITIILLTFTILCFASFGTQTGIIKIFTTPSPGYTGTMIHNVSWGAIDPALLDVLKGRWDDSALVCPRYWLSPRRPTNFTDAYTYGPLVSREDGSLPISLRGVLGMDTREVAARPDLTKLLGGKIELKGMVVLTRAVADHMKVKPGDTVLVGGQKLTVAGLVDSNQLSAMTDMDGTSMLPVDFSKITSAEEQAKSQPVSAEALAVADAQNWATIASDSVALVSEESARQMGAWLHEVTLYTQDTEGATTIAEDMAKMLGLPVNATRQDGVYRHVVGAVLQASGFKDLLFPIVLGALVIFGTMLGSVADREKEIYTFSALGLAPPHVASLFLSEAMVYSVIGGLGGYLIAQGAMKILSILANFGLVQVPEMNYSSTNAIVTILIVMATVLLSAIYPALKASRSANPGILRSWKLPQTDGHVYDITFPFTVSEYDITGVVSFLKEHFDNFQDTGLGVFMAKGTNLVRTNKKKSLGLDSRLALAPFDLGVTQDFELRSGPSEIPGIDEVKIRLTRLSGQPKDWQRLNKVLLDDLRRQFLIWRSLPQETMEIYRHRTLTTMAVHETSPKAEA